MHSLKRGHARLFLNLKHSFIPTRMSQIFITTSVSPILQQAKKKKQNISLPKTIAATRIICSHVSSPKPLGQAEAHAAARDRSWI